MRSKSLARYALALALALHGVVAVAGCTARAVSTGPGAPSIDPLAGVTLACPAPSAQALARARQLERAANARAERVPFDLGEAPASVLDMARAELCYGLAGDRDGRLRCEGGRKVLEADLRRRVAHAQLFLHVGRREGRHRNVLREVRSLLALFSRAGEPAEPYRALLASFESAELDALASEER